MIELIVQKELMLIKQMHLKNVIFVTIGILKILVLSIVYVKGSAYRIHFWYMSKRDTISIMNNSNLADKKGVL